MPNDAYTAVVDDFAPAKPSFFKTLFKAVNTFFDSMTTALIAHRLYTELDALGDSQLKAMGMTRQDIPQYVVKAIGWHEKDV